MSKRIHLTSDERESRIANLRRLLGPYFEKLTPNNLELLQGAPIETVNAAYAKLTSFGIKPEKIASQAQLLAMNPETLQRNFNFLNQTLGIKPEKIASQAQLLAMNPETLQKNFNFLNQTLGIKPDKIASQAQLLGMNP
ncbi:MAG: hypothetical protein QW783_00925, partial [Candidatus Micrarchaeia archaeon]